ncbi:MAG: hypothetical protein AUK47_29200 [Deltaproteobacteria bacterium CG2_30_63_29]|nr:MAG: hypothetical protein AUK47_29200 [Deltaproteobacteria bacterium CG2_30_63_29]
MRHCIQTIVLAMIVLGCSEEEAKPPIDELAPIVEFPFFTNTSPVRMVADESGGLHITWCP